jgi:hypothetical protein
MNKILTGKMFWVIMPIIVGIGVSVFLVWFIMSGAFMVSRPAIKQAEFPISATIEVNGEQITVKDTIIVDFAGFANMGIGDRLRLWESRLKSGDPWLVLLSIESENATIRISMPYGRAAYYMGEFTPQERVEYERRRIERRIFAYERWENNVFDKGYSEDDLWEKGLITGELIDEDKLYKKFGIKLIEINFPKPLESGLWQ